MLFLKLLEQALSPLCLTLEALLLAALLAKLKKKRAAIAVASSGFLVLWLASTPVIARALARPLERDTLPVAPRDSPAADAIVVLGGNLSAARPPRLSAELVDASDRILHAARLYRAGKAPVVVASGGNLPWSASRTPESSEVASLLMEWGVAREALVIEPGSVDTSQNARETARLLGGRKRILLVTSALHMPRAAAVFRKAGFDVVRSPTDFAVIEPERRSALEWIPSASALGLTSAALHERLGILYYRLRGRL